MKVKFVYDIGLDYNGFDTVLSESTDDTLILGGPFKTALVSL